MTQDQKVSKLKKEVRSLLISSKLGLSLDQLKQDYINMMGHPLPLKALGFSNVLDMMMAMPDVVNVRYLRDGSLVLKAVVDDSTRGMGELVARNSGGFFSPRYRKPSSMAPPRRAPAPPALPAQLRAQLGQLLTQGPVGLSELEAGFARRFGRPLRVTDYGFYSVTEMLAAAADLVAIKQSRTGSLLTLKVAPAMGPLAGQVGVSMAPRVTTPGRTGQIEPPPPQQNPSTDTAVRPVGDTGAVEADSPTDAEQGEGLNPSSQGCHLSCGASPWEGRREEEEEEEGEEEEGEEEEDSASNDTDLKSETDLRFTTKTFQQVRSSPGKVVPLDALRGQRLRAPTRRGHRELISVLVEHVESPSNFYIRFNETQEARALVDMMMKMRSCYTCPEVAERYALPSGFVRQGQVCCVDPGDMWFYRVVVHRILSQTQVEVYYVDYGDLTTVDRTSLKFLKSCYSELPAQAVPSSLTGIKPMGGSWSLNATSSFQKLCCERPLVGALDSYHTDFLQVFLCDTNTEEDVYIHSVLQSQGHGISCPSAVNSELCDQFNPVTLYLGEGVFDEGMEVDMDMDQTPDTPQAATRPAVGIKDEVEELLDLPELEYIGVKHVNVKAQDQGWTPDPPTPEVVQPKAAQDLGYHGDTTETWKQPPHRGKEKQQPCHGCVGEGGAPPQPPILRPLSLHTPGLMHTQSSPYGVCVSAPAFLAASPSFIFPLFGSGEVLHVRHPWHFSLGPSARLAAGAHLLHWSPHKMD